MEDEGYTVLDAESGEAALELVERADGIDVVVCDLNLPGISGPELVARLRTRWPRLPVVFMSGQSREDPRVEELSKQPRVAYLAKPFEFEDLARAVGAAVHGVAEQAGRGVVPEVRSK